MYLRSCGDNYLDESCRVMVGNIEQNSKTFVYKHLKLVTDWIKGPETVNDIILLVIRKYKFYPYLLWL